MRISRTTFAAKAGNLAAVLTFALGAASLCSAGSITYAVNLTIGTGSVAGSIVTDGAIGVLAQSDITGYNLLLTDGATMVNLSCCDFFPFAGSDLSATATQLRFDFSGADSGVVDITDASLDFQMCFSTSGGAFGPASACEGAGETLTVMTSLGVFDRQLTSLTGTDAIGTAASAIPEPGTGSLALVGTALAVLGSLRFRRRQRVTHSRP